MTDNPNVEAAGPWLDTRTAAEYLRVPEEELAQLRQAGRVLGVKFNDGRWYHPALQFRNHAVVPGLDQVLEVLMKLGSKQLAATWLAAPALDGTDRTSWDQLADRDLETVLHDARRDVSDWGVDLPFL
jgi:hypothetical protein